MTWKDEILEEIWKFREEYAKSFNYDIIAMGEALMEEEKNSDWVFFSPTKTKKANANAQKVAPDR